MAPGELVFNVEVDYAIERLPGIGTIGQQRYGDTIGLNVLLLIFDVWVFGEVEVFVVEEG